MALLRAFVVFNHKGKWALLKDSDCSLHKEIAILHYQGNTCTRSFGMGLTSRKGQKLECFKWTATKIFYKYFESLVNPLCSEAMLMFHLTQALYVYDVISVNGPG